MKIAILSMYSGHVTRGVENWAHQLSQELSTVADVTIIQSGEQKDADKNYTVKVVDTKINHLKNRQSRLNMFFLDYWSLRVLSFSIKSIKLIHGEDFDILIPTNGGWQSVIIRLYTIFNKPKCVIVGHSGPGWDDRINLLTFPDLFIALSERAQKWAKKVNPFIKVKYVPNGVDLDKFNNSGERVKLSLQRPIFLAVGALEKGKRINLTVEAVAKLNKGSLLVVGDGEMKAEISKVGKKLLGKRFMLTKVSFKDMPSYYRAADVFTLPSWSNEAFGMVYLEAMACNLPVVATDDELRKEIVGDAGILVDPLNIETYSQALLKASKIDWQNKPRNRAEKYSWSEIANQYRQLFASLLK